jgi:hypothetical protein
MRKYVIRIVRRLYWITRFRPAIKTHAITFRHRVQIGPGKLIGDMEDESSHSGRLVRHPARIAVL